MTKRTAKASKLKNARKRTGLSLEAAGERIGLSHSQLSRYESGESSPTVDFLRAAATAYGTQLLDVIDFEHSFIMVELVAKVDLGTLEETKGLSAGRNKQWIPFMPIHDVPVPDGAVVVDTDELDREYPSGTVLFYKKVDDTYKPRTGQHVIVDQIRGNRSAILFREVQLSDNERVLLIPRSTNADHSSLILDPATPSEVKIFALIVSSQKNAKVI